MNFAEQLNIPGEHSFFFEGEVGRLDARLVIPEVLRQPYVALLGHPHSLQGGSMNNKVVTSMARAFRELGIPSIRFNFRGVEHSEGEFDNGIGESADMLCLARLWAAQVPDCRYIFAGFSFGSYVTYRAAAQWPHELLISIAPPVSRFDYNSFTSVPKAWHILQWDKDELISLEEVLAFVEQYQLKVPVHQFVDTGHFFHGKLLELKATLTQIIQDEVLTS